MKNQNNLINHQKSKNVRMFKKGFTLVELLVVIAIIGVMSGIVIISVQGAIAKSKRSSALTSAASILPELVTCADDSGGVRAPASASTGGNIICTAAGHTVRWPNLSKTGWTYNAAADTNISDGAYTFGLTKPAGSTLSNISCSLSSSECT